MHQEPNLLPSKPAGALSTVDFVKKVGKGKTLSQHLSLDESRRAFTKLLNGDFSPAQAGAFLQALRINELSQEELNGLVEVFISRTRLLPELIGDRTLVLNVASDTARKGGLVCLLAAQLLRRFGISVGLIRSTPVLSGNRESFEKTFALAQLLDTELGPFSKGDSLAPAPVVCDTSSLVQGLADLDALRGELGFRSCLHTAEKLVNPWPRSRMLLGISHQHYALRLGGTMATFGLEGRILLGNHGTVDLVLHKETEMITVQAKEVKEEALSHAGLGLEMAPDVYSLAKFPQWHEWLVESRDNGLIRAVQYHLAAFLWMAGLVPTVAAGLAASRQAIPKLFKED